MISQIKQKGFTIVELLIVIVIIAILAAISMAAYTNITARANTSTAAAAAKTVRDVASAYNSANAGWPTSKAQFVSGGADAVAKLPSDITFGAVTAAPTPATGGPKRVQVQQTPATGAPLGFRVTYWDFTADAVVHTYVGDASSSSTFSSTPVS